MAKWWKAPEDDMSACGATKSAGLIPGHNLCERHALAKLQNKKTVTELLINRVCQLTLV